MKESTKRKELLDEEDRPVHGGGRRHRSRRRDARLGPAHRHDRTGASRGQAPALPKLPAEIANRKRFIVGVKCDTPPFGYLDVRGKNAGVDVEIAQWFARYAFGREQRLTFVCAPTAVREPLLTNGRVDLVISTFTYTADRDTRIDFSRAYYKATGRLLVRNDSPIQSLADIGGKKVATTSGSVYDRWMKRCFTSTEVVVVDSVTNAVLAFNQGRVDAVMFDDTSLALIAATNPAAKLTDDLFLEGPYGIGIKQGNVELKRWVDARLNLMKRKDIFQHDHQEQHRAALRPGVLEEHPATEQRLRLPGGEPAERRHGVPVA